MVSEHFTLIQKESLPKLAGILFSKVIKKFLRLPAGFEDDDLLIPGVVQERVVTGAVVLIEVPDPLDEFRVDPFGARKSYGTRA